jgi:Thioredoxin-like proteins and domains
MSSHNGSGAGSEENHFRERAVQIERLVERAQAIPDRETRAFVLDLLQAVMGLHADCLERLLVVVEEQHPALLDSFGKDPAINVLLALYGLHPEPLEARVRGALDKVRPYLQSHSGDVELLEVAESTVKVRLVTRGSGCGVATLKQAVERSIYENAPEVAEVIAEQASVLPASQLVQLR